MLNKFSFLAGLAAGYVAGARGGRSQYDALKAQGTKAVQHPQVQAKVAQAADAVKAKAPAQAHGLVDKAVDAVSGGSTPASVQTPGTTTGALDSGVDAPRI